MARAGELMLDANPIDIPNGKNKITINPNSINNHTNLIGMNFNISSFLNFLSTVVNQIIDLIIAIDRNVIIAMRINPTIKVVIKPFNAE